MWRELALFWGEGKRLLESFLLGGPTTSAVGMRASFGLLASAHLTDPAMAHGSFRLRRATAQLAMACLEWILSP